MNIREFTEMPKEERDRILAKQAKESVDYYANDKELKEFRDADLSNLKKERIMRKLFMELPILFKEDDEATFEQIADFSALTPDNIHVNVTDIMTIEDNPFHGEGFCLIRYQYDQIFTVPMSRTELVDKIHKFLSED